MSKLADNAAQKIEAKLQKCDDLERKAIQDILALGCDAVPGMELDYKWGWPCLHYHGLIMSVAAFKAHMSLNFFQGALLDDPQGVLSKGEGGNLAMRTWKFTKDTPPDARVLRPLIIQAADNMRSGKRVVIRAERKSLVFPDPFKDKLIEEGVWEVLSKMAYSHQKEYLEYYTGAKQEATKERRLTKIVALLRQGQGLNDKYK